MGLLVDFNQQRRVLNYIGIGKQAVAIANEANFGLAAGIWTTDRRTRTSCLIMDMLSLRCHLARLWMQFVG